MIVRKIYLNNKAVSPVVGVMLMLVVTIIIAAVVSAFAGGLSHGTPKAPQLSITAEAHDASYILIDFKGGDTVGGSSIMMKTFVPSGTYKDMSNQVNLKNVTYLPTGEKLKTDWSAKTIQTGDKIKIDWADAFAASSYGGYMAPSVGEPVDIEIYDSATGKMIVTAQTTVLP